MDPTDRPDFEPIDYDNLTIAELKVATNSIVDISVQILEKTLSKKVNGKTVLSLLPVISKKSKEK